MQTVAGGGVSATYSYLANSPLVEQVVFKQGANTRMTTTKSYDRLNRLSKISSVPSASSAVSFEFALVQLFLAHGKVAPKDPILPIFQ
jgi:hypothetical protein